MAGSDVLARGTGRRKTAVCRVRLLAGSGGFRLNGRPLQDYFPNPTHQRLLLEPLKVTETLDRYDVVATLHGGGVSGQAGALRHALSRALIDLDSELRGELKRRGFLRRDDREVERKKYGLKKARKAPQYSKR